MTYSIISTGSIGNAVIINSTILIDCGVSYKKIEPFVKDITIVLLTHIHNDHFKKATIKRLALERPTLRFGCGEWLVSDLVQLVETKNIDIYNMENVYDYSLFLINPVLLSHNVPNCGYRITMNNETLFYATDTNSLEGIIAPNYDWYMVEGNYSQEEIEFRIKEKIDTGQYIYEYGVLNNHLSIEKATNWIYKNAGANSNYIFLHEHKDKQKN